MINLFHWLGAICDDFFVPVLEIICEKFKLNDDVAGATFMAAGKNIKIKKKGSQPLCSRNFQNVKLRLDFVEIWSFYRHSDSTWNRWNPILANSNGHKMAFF